MGRTLIEKIISDHAGQAVSPGEIVDITIDVRAARDFGGANVCLIYTSDAADDK